MSQIDFPFINLYLFL